MKSHGNGHNSESAGHSNLQCATSGDHPLTFVPNNGWNPKPPGDSPCSPILCTQQSGAIVTVPQLQGSTFTMAGFYHEDLFASSHPNPGEIDQVFTAQLDGNSIDLAQQLSLNQSNNTFEFNVNIHSGRDGGHTFTFTNIQNTTGICIIGPPSGSGSGPASSSTLPSTTGSIPVPSPPSTSTAPQTLTKGGTSPGQIAIAVIIPIFVIICLLLLTLYLRRRWRQQKVSVPLSSEGLKLDEPDRLETGSSYKAWSPSQSPFLPEHPIPRQERRPAPPRRGQRHFASFTLSSVSSIPEPPPSVNPPSTVSSRSSVLGIAQATLGRLKPVRKDPPDARRGVLRAVNVGDE